MPKLPEDWNLLSFAKDQVSNLIWLVCLVAAPVASRWIYGRVSAGGRFGATAKLFFSSTVIFAGILAAVGVEHWWKVGLGYLALLLAALLSLRGLSRAGVSDAFDKTIKGIDFKKSLNLIQSNCAFLGIGADKLTSLPEFELAMQRCSTHGKICRFLLSPPNNTLLERLAKRNGEDPRAYEKNVIESLRRIARLKIDKGLNIEVRFYPFADRPDFQQFRLLFIDEKICLLSWTVWGPHRGTANPQIVLRDFHDTRRSTLYQALMGHFDELWASAPPVDLNAYK